MEHHVYRRIVDRIEPDSQLEKRLEQRLQQQQRSLKPWGTRMRMQMRTLVAAGIAILVAGGAFAGWSKLQAPPAGDSIGQVQSGQVIIPKIKLPKNLGNANMIGLVVYQGNIYTQTAQRQLEPELATALRGEKLGTTAGEIDEWSTSADYKELTSNMGPMDIYEVKGYDSSFRIMAYEEGEDGEIYAQFLECWNGLIISGGSDIFGKLKLDGRVTQVFWQDYGSWYNSKPLERTLPFDGALEEAIAAANAALPLDGTQLYEDGIYNDAPNRQKLIFLQLEDRTMVQLRLFAGNYIKYDGANVFFQLDEAVFAQLWDQLQ